MPRGWAHPEVVGEYAATARLQWGRVVYKHQDQQLYLAVGVSNGIGRVGWVVQRAVTKVAKPSDILLYSFYAPSLCPADPEANPVNKVGPYWYDESKEDRRFGWQGGIYSCRGQRHLHLPFAVRCLIHLREENEYM